MSIQKGLKKGFTLIELMVVIVIIGILAAVAIPKLFGMSAKAKASEVGPAASTWIKLQMAYAVETSNFGGFTKIGYTPPGKKESDCSGRSCTGNFSYDEADATDDSGEWQAKNLEKLNECKNSNVWSVKIDKLKGSDGGYEGESITADPGDDECEALTPSFKKLEDTAGGSGST